MLLIYGNQVAGTDPDMMAKYQAYTEDIVKKDLMRAGDALHAVESAKTVRVRNGAADVTDGPFAETKEQLGGYYILECKDMDQAVEYAAKIPGAVNGSIEVRPIMDMGA
jgi:hypothetical protein